MKSTNYLTLRKISFLIFVLLILCTGTLPAQEEYVNDHVIVFFRDNVLKRNLLTSDYRLFNRTDLITEKALTDSLDKWRTGSTFQKVVRNARPDKTVSDSHRGEEVTIPMFYNLMYVPVPENEEVLAFCKKLNKLPYVIYAEPDYIMRSNDVPPPDDPYFYLQAGWEQVNDRDIDLLRAWDFTRGSNSIRVGVLDGGIDYHNPDLGYGSYGSGFKVSGGYDYVGDDSDPDDIGITSHGTSVAGIIGALSNNNTGVAGIAGGNDATGNIGVQLIALRVADADEEFSMGKVVDGIYDAATSVSQGGFGCHILNFSAGGNDVSNSLRKAISYAVHKGVVFVASKGNEESTEMHYPSDYADNLIISVGASDWWDQRKEDSNYGNDMDIVAPGVGSLLYTTKRAQQESYGPFGGTSGAAAVASGIVALLKSVNINLHRDDIESIIEISAEDITSEPNAPGQFLIGYDIYTGHGRVNAGRVLELLQTPYILEHHSITGGTSQKITSGNGEPLIFLNDAGTTLPEGWYYGQKYQVTKTVNIPLSGCNERYIWPRSVGATLGWSAANPNNNLGFSHIVSQTETTVTLRTYVYYIKYNLRGQTINAWYPTSPQNAVIAYTTLTNMPINSTVTGPSIVCTSGAQFTINNLPPVDSIIWACGPCLTITSGQYTSTCTFSATGSGSSWVRARLVTGCGSITLPRIDVWSGVPQGYITGPTEGYVEGSYIFYAYPATYSNPFSYEWSLTPVNDGNCIYNYGDWGYAVFYWPYEEYYQISCTAQNLCGTGSLETAYIHIYGYGGYGFSTSPNPASTEVTISVTKEGKNYLINTDLSGTVFDVSIYDMYGVKHHQGKYSGERFIIPVHNLKDGNYAVQINDGKKVTNLKLIVKH